MAKKKAAKKVAKEAAATVQVVEMIQIPAVVVEVMQVPIRGIGGGLVVHNWSEKAIAMMLAKQMHRQLEPQAAKDPHADYLDTLYTATDGTTGFPATAFKDAMVRAAKGINGLDMITMRQMIFIEADCEEDREFTIPMKGMKVPVKHRIQTPLVRLLGRTKKETHQMRMDMVRLNGKTADIRFRAHYPKWEAILTINYMANRIGPEQVANLVNLGGHTVGVGEGRPEKSTDMTWGRWEVDMARKPKGRKR